MDMTCDPNGTMAVDIADWTGFDFSKLRPRIVTDQGEATASASSPSEMPDGSQGWAFTMSDGTRLLVGINEVAQNQLELSYWLANDTDRDITLKRGVLFETDSARFGDDPEQTVQYFQGTGYADVKPLRLDTVQTHEPKPAEPNTDKDTDDQPSPPAPAEQVVMPETHDVESQSLWLVYDRKADRAMLVGTLTEERWVPFVHASTDSDGNVKQWSFDFDGGDLLVPAGDRVQLESVTFMAGDDPYALLERYGDRVAQNNTIELPKTPPVSWCSWYPYRLGVTEDRILETARIAEARLKPLGLTIILMDLGWEDRYLPSTFEPNDQFPSGMADLSKKLRDMGFVIGLWKAPFAVSEFDPIVAEHPDWLIRDDEGKPIKAWTWFWEPHGDVYCWDLTNPEVTEYLRSQFERFHDEYQIGYYKSDFSGFAAHGITKRRSDKQIVQGGGNEAARTHWQVFNDVMPDALLLNCFGPQLPGTGQCPLLYCCQDTGNTGVLSWLFMERNFRTMAGVLWKNHRWGIIQPSCLVVGLPGTLEEARIRATVAFCVGGQIDISDTLTTLPEDRWQVLEATLPPLGVTAKPIDLFDPIFDPGSEAYEAQCKGEESEVQATAHTPGSVWQVVVEDDWDQWQLVAVFDLDNSHGHEDSSKVKRFNIPLERLGLDPDENYWLTEFWSQQFLGELRAKRTNPGGYEHPGDHQDLLAGSDDKAIDIAFAGPAVKLLCVRKVRPHPWVVATTFHQSCGKELNKVTWDQDSATLSGELERPAGMSGSLLLTSAGRTPVEATCDGQPVQLIPTANGGWKLPLVTRHDTTAWTVRFEK